MDEGGADCGRGEAQRPRRFFVRARQGRHQPAPPGHRVCIGLPPLEPPEPVRCSGQAYQVVRQLVVPGSEPVPLVYQQVVGASGYVGPMHSLPPGVKCPSSALHNRFLREPEHPGGIFRAFGTRLRLAVVRLDVDTVMLVAVLAAVGVRRHHRFPSALRIWWRLTPSASAISCWLRTRFPPIPLFKALMPAFTSFRVFGGSLASGSSNPLVIAASAVVPDQN